MVRSHCDYISTKIDVVWGQRNDTLIDRLQLLHNKAARVITEVKYEDTDHLGLICQLGLLTVRGLIKLDLGNFIYKAKTSSLKQLGISYTS